MAFIGPLTGGVASVGIGGRNSAELAVALRNADPGGRYRYKRSVFDDQSAPETGAAVVKEACRNEEIDAAVAHYCF